MSEADFCMKHYIYLYFTLFAKGCQVQPPGVPDNCVGVAPPVAAGAITPCEVAMHIRNAGFPESQVARFVCIAKYESGHRCGATNTANADGSADYGLFQCNSGYWCSGGQGTNHVSDSYRHCKLAMHDNGLLSIGKRLWRDVSAASRLRHQCTMCETRLRQLGHRCVVRVSCA
jgi:hypothetical protein